MGSPGLLRGRPIMFDAPTTIRTPVGSFTEVISPSSISSAVLADGRIAAVRDHNASLLLARQSAGTLRLAMSAGGVDMGVVLPDSALGQETAVLVSRGDLRGASFSFEVGAVQWFDGPTSSDPPVCMITRIDRLWDVSPCTYPAYEQTFLSLQSGDTSSLLAEKMHDLEMRGRRGIVRNDERAARTRHAQLAMIRGRPCRSLPPQARWANDRFQKVKVLS